jgi:tripartite-type tricarboxylate transporter receptor subunit TctC
MKNFLASILRTLSLAVAMGLSALPAAAQVQAYPAKPVKIVVGFAPGGGSDIVARVIAQKLSELWGQPVVVENRPGASGTIGADFVAKSAPDGYTLLVSSATSTAVAATLFPKLPYNVLRDFQIVTVVGSTPSLLVINPALGPKTMQEFAAFAKANPSRVFFGGSGQGSTGHLTGELFNLSLGIKTGHVPYKGEPPALTDLIGGNLTFVFSSLPVVLPLVKSGQLRALAITSLKRSGVAPEFPTVAETGIPEFESVAWNALYAPSGVPRSIIQRIHMDTVKVLQMPDVQARFSQLGIEIVGNSPEQATAYLESETAKWERVIKAANIRVD